MAAIQYYNQGTIMDWCTKCLADTNEVRFHRVFWTFAPSIEGFKYCCLVMNINVTNLYGKHIKAK